MEYAVIATPADATGLRLDWERFSYAGKFVMTNTGTAVVVDDASLPGDADWPPEPTEAQAPGVIAAVSFNRDRQHSDAAWLRYVTVREDYRGQGIGPRLCAFTTEWVLDAFEIERVRIAVNNPYAFDALHKAGFAWTGEETGLRERVLEYPRPTDVDAVDGSDASEGSEGERVGDSEVERVREADAERVREADAERVAGVEAESDAESRGDSVEDRYRDGLRSYLDTDLEPSEVAFVETHIERGLPSMVDVPKGEDYTGGARTHR